MALFNAMWLPATAATLTVPQTSSTTSIVVGPSIQAITASSPSLDATSLTAFAKQQGLDAQAIAWLMDPRAQASKLAQASSAGGVTAPLSPDLPVGTTGQGLVPALAGQAGGSAPVRPMVGTEWASTAPPADWGSLAQASGLVPEALPGSSAPPLPSAPTLTTTATGTTTPNAPTMPDASGWMPPSNTDTHATATAPAASGGAVAMAALGAAATGIQIALSVSDARPPSPAPATAVPVGPEWATLGEFKGLPVRWSGVKAANTGQAERSTPATTTSTPWAQSDLDLSGLDLPLATDTPTPSNTSTTADQPSGDNSAIASAAVGLAGRSPTNAAHTHNGTATAQATSNAGSSDKMQQLSEKMADAVGQRMLREIERGQWNLRLMLKPAHLGHIEVEMRLHAGALEATFAAPQAATRELLQDGLGRLRDQLNQSGMDVANLNIKNGQNRQNGGDSTPGQRQSTGSGAPNTPDTPEAATSSVPSAPRPRRPDGWDVMV